MSYQDTNLVLSRKPGEAIVVNGPCTLRVLQVSGNRVKVAVNAQQDVKILRGELVEKAA